MRWIRRTALVLVVLTCAALVAMADVDRLGGGVFIVHAPAGMQYTNDPPAEGWCAKYENEMAIADSAGQIVRIDANGSASIWFVLAAWIEPKEFCGVEFGFGDYDPAAYAFYEWESCADLGFLEIDTPGWPGPNEGTAVARSGGSHVLWSGNYVPVYYFAGYAYSGVETVISLNVNPERTFGGFGRCVSPAQTWAAECFGGMGINTDGIPCGPGLPPPEYVCCKEGYCFLATDEDCTFIGGEWHEGLEDCQADPCPVYAACCVGSDCFLLAEEDCMAFAGIWYRGYACDEGYTCADFADLRACCVEDVCILTWEDDCAAAGGTWRSDWYLCGLGENNLCKQLHVCCVVDLCNILLLDECALLGGDWVADSVACTATVCPVPAVQPSSWRRIKAIYR